MPPKKVFQQTDKNVLKEHHMTARRKLLISLLPMLLMGCGSLQFIDSTGHAYPGNFDSVSKKLEADINGEKYSGFYVTNSGTAFVSGSSYGAQPTYSTGQAYYSGNSGRAILRSADGDTIQCEFSYQGLSAIGTCVGAAGERYQLVTQ